MQKILLVLESEDLEIALTDVLAADYDVAVFRSYDALFSQPCDALVLDLFLPGVDGFSLLRRCHGPRPPVVVLLTNLLNSDILQAAEDLGIHVLIRKPFPVSALVSRLGGLLSCPNV